MIEGYRDISNLPKEEKEKILKEDKKKEREYDLSMLEKGYKYKYYASGKDKDGEDKWVIVYESELLTDEDENKLKKEIEENFYIEVVVLGLTVNLKTDNFIDTPEWW